ncbi:MAG: efflux RND transporter periplasmic adaptor subunit [Pseudomonadota bacterium]
MRLFPIIAAILVIALIYAFVFQRNEVTALLAAPGTEAPDTDDAALDEAQDAKDLVGVIVVNSVARVLDRAVEVRGQTEADREVQLRAETSGQVVSEPLRKGSFVEAGQLICELDPGVRQSLLAEAQAMLAESEARLPEADAKVPEAQARVTEARARVTEAQSRLAEAKINANAAEKLSNNGFASTTRVAATEAAVRGAEAAVVSAEAGLKAAESGLESVAAGIEAARAGRQSAQALVDSAQKEISRLQITAPFAGLLESDSAELGSLLQDGSLCATVIQLNPIMLVGFVPETQVSLVDMGAMATGELASGETVEGEVVFISRSADPTTRTFRVEIEVPNEDLSLRDGQTAEIAIQAAGTGGHLLAPSALTLNDDGELGVRTVSAENIVEFHPVELLRDTPTGMWLSGLPDQVQVIVVGQEFVKAGVKVKPYLQEVGQ